MSSRQMTIDQLELSPFNARTNRQDATSTAALEASLLTRGQLLPLIVHPMRGRKNKWGVFAGGRRYRSLKNLIERGDLPRDHPIDVVERDLPEAELLEVSVAENFLRRDLRPYEIFAAVTAAARRGDRPERIAETLGQEIYVVKQWLRLGNLAKPIFEALEAEQISLDQAKAYGSTEDQALQLAAFEALSPRAPHERGAQSIHRYLKVGDRELSRMLRFIGPEAYAAAGGLFELDLFADGAEARGRVEDEGLLRRLVDDALGGLRDDIRTRTGRTDLRFVAEPPGSGYGGPDYLLEVTPRTKDDGTIAIPDGDVVAHVKLSEGGQPEVSYWWASRSAKHGSAPRSRSTMTIRAGGALNPQDETGSRQAADGAIKEDAGLTQDGVQVFRSIRRVIMRAGLVANARKHGDVALDYLVWSQLRLTLAPGAVGEIGMKRIALPDAGPESARDYVAATEASHLWGMALFEVQQQTFFTGTDLADAFEDYCCSSPSLKRLTAAIVTGIAIERSLNADGYQLPIHDYVAGKIGLGSDEAIRALWTPTAELLALLPKAEQLAIAEPFVERAAFGPWSRLKAKELTEQVLKVVTGTGEAVRASLADAAARWVHPLLRFGAPAPAEVEAAQETEAAE